MKFIDLHAHSILSCGVDTQARMLFNAKKLGVELGLCDGVKSECNSGIEIRAKNKSELKSSLSNPRNFDYVVINGGDEHINRLATSDNRVDILAHPDAGRKDPGVDSFVAKQAHKNGVAIEFNLRNLILTTGSRRVNALKNVARTLKLSRKYGFDIIVTSGAKSRFELRSGDGVFQLLKLLGFEKSEAEAAMVSVPQKILDNKFRGAL
jgi:ribonuclease P/MRP protein subunit RPP1